MDTSITATAGCRLYPVTAGVALPPAWLAEWSQWSADEPHMLTVTAEELATTLLCATVALNGEKPVGFAGVFPARTRAGGDLVWSNRRLVEFGSAVVASPWRGRHIGRMMLQARQRFVCERGWVGVCVSTNPIVHSLLADNGWQITTEPLIRRSLCLCRPVPEGHCSTCPLKENGCWLCGV